MQETLDLCNQMFPQFVKKVTSAWEDHQAANWPKSGRPVGADHIPLTVTDLWNSLYSSSALSGYEVVQLLHTLLICAVARPFHRHFFTCLGGKTRAV